MPADIRSFFKPKAKVKPSVEKVEDGKDVVDSPGDRTPILTVQIGDTPPSKEVVSKTQPMGGVVGVEVAEDLTPQAGKRKHIVIDDDEDDLVVLDSAKKAKRDITPKKLANAPTRIVSPMVDKVAVKAGALKRIAGQTPKYSIMSEDASGAATGQQWYQERALPPNKGRKDTPRGDEVCLLGLTFVITGILDSLERSEAEDFVKRHGGRVTGSVSGKTDFLIAGQDSGRSKVAQAKAKEVHIIDEDMLFSLIHCSKPQSVAPRPAVDGSVAEWKKQGQASFKTEPALPRAKQSQSVDENELWTSKYRPASVDDLVGHGSVATLLRNWLIHWDGMFLRNEPPPPPLAPKPGARNKGPIKKALLFSGPPGIGKTSVAKMICENMGYDLMEVNASDARGKADSKAKAGMNGKISNQVKELVTNKSINCMRSLAGVEKKKALIMDEVDGMSGGDRGGVTELINVIKKSKIPIICICNDKYSQKLKSLKNHVTEVDFRRPTKQMIARRLTDIARREGLDVNDAAMEKLAEESNGDLRLCLNMLQIWGKRSNTIRYDDVSKNMAQSGKDLDMGPFTVIDKLFAPDSLSLPLWKRMDLAFHDIDLIPLMFQENYLNYKGLSINSDQRFDRLVHVADRISESDVISAKIRRDQKWGLLPLQMLTGVVEGAGLLRGGREPFHPADFMNRFPAWLGKNSSAGKGKRLVQEIQSHMLVSHTCFPSPTSVRLDYLPAFKAHLSQPLKDEGKEGIKDVIDIMDAYSLNREDWNTILAEFQFKVVWSHHQSSRPALCASNL
eukprot:scaffold106_cov380-Prasinococcus_capsulatus_cf.AAC.15